MSKWGKMRAGKRECHVVIERDEDGYYVGEVPQLLACYSQGWTLDELMTNLREVVELCLDEAATEFIGFRRWSSDATTARDDGSQTDTRSGAGGRAGHCLAGY